MMSYEPTCHTGLEPSREGVLWYIRALLRRYGITPDELVEEVPSDG